MLLDRTMTILDISNRGYDDPVTSAVFKKNMGISPSQYRKHAVQG